MASWLAKLLLALALLAGWQLALLHPLQHLNPEGGFVHLGSGDSGKSGTTDPLCDAIAALATCAPGASTGALPAARSLEAAAAYDAIALRAAEPPPFLAQGPPALL